MCPPPLIPPVRLRLSGVQYMLLSTFFFALMNVCVKLLPGIPAHESVFFRSLGMWLICSVLLLHTRTSPRGNRKGLLLLRGLFGSIGLGCYFYTLKYMPLATAVTLQYLNPIFSTALAVWMLQEPVQKRQWAYFGISFAGVLLIKGFNTQVSGFLLALGLLAAFSSGVAYNLVRQLRGQDHPLVIMFYFAGVNLVLMTPYTLTHWQQPQQQEWLWLLLVGVFTYLAQDCMTRALQSERMAKVAGLNYLGMLYALALGFFFFNEPLSPLALVGMLLIVAGVIRGQQQPARQATAVLKSG